MQIQCILPTGHLAKGHAKNTDPTGAPITIKGFTHGEGRFNTIGLRQFAEMTSLRYRTNTKLMFSNGQELTLETKSILTTEDKIPLGNIQVTFKTQDITTEGLLHIFGQDRPPQVSQTTFNTLHNGVVTKKHSSLQRFVNNLSTHLDREKEKEQLIGVLTNEAGDLSSISCAIVLAYSLTITRQKQHIPILAFNRSELALHTEALFALKSLQLNPRKLIFADDIGSQHHKITYTILMSSKSIADPIIGLNMIVASVLDHLKLGTASSCATLIAEKILKPTSNPQEVLDSRSLTLLRTAILLDTDNLNPTNGKTMDKDRDIVSQIERKLCESPVTRKEVVTLIKNAKRDITNFDCRMIIRKDLKTMRFSSFTVAISVLPVPSCLSIAGRKDFEEHMTYLKAGGEDDSDTFQGYELIILMGGEHDIIISPGRLQSAVASKLSQASGRHIESNYNNEIQMMHMRYLKGSSEYPREVIMPIIHTAITDYLAIHLTPLMVTSTTPPLNTGTQICMKCNELMSILSGTCIRCRQPDFRKMDPFWRQTYIDTLDEICETCEQPNLGQLDPFHRQTYFDDLDDNK